MNTMKKLIRNWRLITGLFIIMGFVLCGIYGYTVNYLQLNNLANRSLPPDNTLLRYILAVQTNTENVRGCGFLGTDNGGRDVLSILLGGALTSLLLLSISVTIALVVGIFFSIIPQLVVRKVRHSILNPIIKIIISKIVNFLAYFIIAIPESYPFILPILIFASLSRFNLLVEGVVLGYLFSIQIYHLINLKISLFEKTEHYMAAKEIGLSDATIMFKHILWYYSRNDIILRSLKIAVYSIVIEATLSYLFVSASTEYSSLGKLVFQGGSVSNIYHGIYWQVVPPAVMILVVILGFNLLSDWFFIKFNSK